MKAIVSEIVGQKASDLNPSYKINCFTTVISYFKNQTIDGLTSAQAMLEWLQSHTNQVLAFNSDTIVVVWSTSNQSLSPDKVEVSKMLKSSPGYPFGLVMEHAAVFLNQEDVFQKASPKDSDPFEIINFNTMMKNHYSHLPWLRTTFHEITNL